MNRIDTKLRELKQQGRKALIPYLTIGDPSFEVSLQAMHQLVESGADILELGMAFSDPVADGPVIQAAHMRALENQVTLEKVFAVAKQFRETNETTPLVLMTYLNPIESMGYDAFISHMVTAGIDGVILVDMPPEEGDALVTVMQAHNVHPIFLVAPTTSKKRLQFIASIACGFLYVVALKGVTGANTLDTEAVQQQVANIRQETDLPLAVGFGIRDGETAKMIAEAADAVVVGSALVSLMEKYGDQNDELLKQIGGFTQSLRQAIDSNTKTIA